MLATLYFVEHAWNQDRPTMPDPNYVWWIDELTRSPLPTGGVIVHRLYEYGPLDTADEAEKMIDQLKEQPRFRESDLRAAREKRKP
jgi:hypothetical protein